jgi:hypothetical protein
MASRCPYFHLGDLALLFLCDIILPNHIQERKVTTFGIYVNCYVVCRLDTRGDGNGHRIAPPPPEKRAHK